MLEKSSIIGALPLNAPSLPAAACQHKSSSCLTLTEAEVTRLRIELPCTVTATGMASFSTITKGPLRAAPGHDGHRATLCTNQKRAFAQWCHRLCKAEFHMLNTWYMSFSACLGTHVMVEASCGATDWALLVLWASL